MDNPKLESLLESLRTQSYPLTVSEDEAEALVECFRRIMQAVPEDDRIFVRTDYDLATSALCHPDPRLSWS